MHPQSASLEVSQSGSFRALVNQSGAKLCAHSTGTDTGSTCSMGLSLASAELDLDGNRHDTGWIHAWTGANADFSGADTRSTVASIDQRIAREISRNDRLPSLELALNDARETGRPVAYSPAGIRLLAGDGPGARIWARVFGPSNAPIRSPQDDKVF